MPPTLENFNVTKWLILLQLETLENFNVQNYLKIGQKAQVGPQKRVPTG